MRRSVQLRERRLSEANIQLVVDDSLDLLQACKEFAGVVSRSVYPEKCYTTGDGLKTATIGEEATVTLHARDKDDRECMGPQLVRSPEKTLESVQKLLPWFGTVSLSPNVVLKSS